MFASPAQSILKCGQSPEDISPLRGSANAVLAPTPPPRPSDPGEVHRISCQSAKALMGTAAAGSGHERPGDGVSPGARPADQITPEPPEEQPAPTPRSFSRARSGQVDPVTGTSGEGRDPPAG